MVASAKSCWLGLLPKDSQKLSKRTLGCLDSLSRINSLSHDWPHWRNSTDQGEHIILILQLLRAWGHSLVDDEGNHVEQAGGPRAKSMGQAGPDQLNLNICVEPVKSMMTHPHGGYSVLLIHPQTCLQLACALWQRWARRNSLMSL